MKLTVRLRRNKTLFNQDKAVIRGHILAVNTEGENILKPGIRNIEEAKNDARRFIADAFKPTPVEIEFEVAEPQAPAPKETKRR